MTTREVAEKLFALLYPKEKMEECGFRPLAQWGFCWDSDLLHSEAIIVSGDAAVLRVFFKAHPETPSMERAFQFSEKEIADISGGRRAKRLIAMLRPAAMPELVTPENEAIKAKAEAMRADEERARRDASREQKRRYIEAHREENREYQREYRRRRKAAKIGGEKT